jgi:hypothetical protein
MSTGAVIAVVVVLVAIAIVAAPAMTRRGGAGSPGLKRRFGPEYERTLARHDGDAKVTRRELAERVKRYGGIEPRPLSAESRRRHTESWAAVQSRFVDEPGSAVSEADRLVAGLAAERGYPGADSPEHFDALSVHHPHQVQGYRHAHALAGHGPAGHRATEDLRQGLLEFRELFDELLRDAGRARVSASAPGSGAMSRLTGKKPLPELERAPRSPSPERGAPAEKSAVTSGTSGTSAGRSGDKAAGPGGVRGSGADPGSAESGPDRHRPLST